jgi:hypothetical protein
MSLYMAFSRKYGTVWYHPASSKLWHLTTLPFVNFRKIDWHALESARVLSQLVRLAVCLARGVDFASTMRITCKVITSYLAYHGEQSI